MALVCTLINVYLLVLFARIILSWFPGASGGSGAMGQISDVLRRVTDPVLVPVQRVIPPIGMFDVSTLVVIIGLQVLRGALCGGRGGFL